jgi:hypothetical protein
MGTVSLFFGGVEVGLKKSGYGHGHSHPSSADVKNEYSCTSQFPLFSSHGMIRDDLYLHMLRNSPSALYLIITLLRNCESFISLIFYCNSLVVGKGRLCGTAAS